jgi:type I restriction enzyme R subunit
MSAFVESHVEEAALEWFGELGYEVRNGPDISPGGASPERTSYNEVVFVGRLRSAALALNPLLSSAVVDEAIRRVLRRDSPSLVEENRRLHQLLVDGVDVEGKTPTGEVAFFRVRLVDWEDADANDFLVVNQFTVHEGDNHRRPDVVVFVNGLPLAVIELKNPADENATVDGAFNQLQTYKNELPSLFLTNEVLVASDGIKARVGSLTSEFSRFVPWKTVDGRELASPGMPELQVVIKGLFQRERFLRMVRHFVVFESDGAKLEKKLAAYHQFHAVESAVAATLAASRPDGNRRVGVVWHTQGSGKSLTMVFYAGRIVLEQGMENPTLVVLTDRNDLDDQLYGTFSRCSHLLRQTPQRAETRSELQELLKRASGGVVFTTIQKFSPAEDGEAYPMLSDRRNIVVIADEAHRSQYGFEAKLEQKTGELSYGFAKHLRDALPNASFIGFTGTPIELNDKSTKQVFGDYIDVYDIRQAVEDGATVRIYYESRLAKLELDEDERPHIDEEMEEVTEGEEEESKAKLKRQWAALEAVVGAEKRLALIARDLVEHFEHRQEAMDGKALVVCMSRRICVALFDEIVKLRPEWDNADDAQGVVKVVMTGSAADNPAWQQHIRSKDGREKMALRFKDAADPLKIVLVRDMWLTGFDVPSLHTMYVDKPMQGHGLMQAIARVNRVFRDKQGGLVVDYLGLADELRSALATYTQSGGRGRPAEDITAEALATMLEKFEVVCDLYHAFDWKGFTGGSGAQRLTIVGGALEHVLGLEDGKNRYLKAVNELTLAFSLVAATDEAIAIRDELAFFQAVRACLAKKGGGSGKTGDELDHAVRQILSRALVSDEVVDIFAVAGLEKPDISILSDEFLAEVRQLPQRNLAVELLQRLLNDEVKAGSKRNVVQSRGFLEMLERTLAKYHNRSIETAQVIEELIALAKEMQAAKERGEALGLTDDEVAFYDALSLNHSAVQVMGDEQLRVIAREVVKTLRANVTVDWTLRETVRARLRVLVRRLLARYGYPPDLQAEAVKTVITQAEALAEGWAA